MIELARASLPEDSRNLGRRFAQARPKVRASLAEGSRKRGRRFAQASPKVRARPREGSRGVRLSTHNVWQESLSAQS